MLNTKLHEELMRKAHCIKVKVEEGGYLPEKAHDEDAGFDLRATTDIILYPGQVIKHPLNIRMELPYNSWAEITTKSGLGAKGQLVYAGVIDEGYRGIPHVVMTNVKMTLLDNGQPNLEPLVFKKGDKIAQLIMNPYNRNFFVEQVDQVDTNTTRSDKGFGSSGR